MNNSAPEQVAGVVVLYNPALCVLENICSYVSQVGALFAVDNSEKPDPEFVKQLAAVPGVSYHSSSGNIGIASALNTGAKLAIANGYGYLLTMDQDSRAESGMVSELLQCMLKPEHARVGIVAPFHATKPGRAPVSAAACRAVPYVMTSGNLLNLRAYLEVGGFRDDLFIDFVDVEYCLRMNSAGYSVLQAPNSHLEHKVGDLVDVGFSWSVFRVTSHSPLRMYYKTRNRFFVADLYRRQFPAFRWRDRFRFILEICRLILFEPQKGAKIAMLWRGLDDYRRGKLGKYDE